MDAAGNSTQAPAPAPPSICDTCRQPFSCPSACRRHVKSLHDLIRFPCPYCGKRYTRRGNLKKHMLECAKRPPDSAPHFEDSNEQAFEPARSPSIVVVGDAVVAPQGSDAHVASNAIPTIEARFAADPTLLLQVSPARVDVNAAVALHGGHVHPTSDGIPAVAAGHTIGHTFPWELGPAADTGNNQMRMADWIDLSDLSAYPWLSDYPWQSDGDTAIPSSSSSKRMDQSAPGYLGRLGHEDFGLGLDWDTYNADQYFGTTRHNGDAHENNDSDSEEASRRHPSTTGVLECC